MKPNPKCTGPVYYGDQGIEWCETCDGCLCCDAADVDHSEAQYRCWRNSEGECFLVDNKAHPGHVCDERPAERPLTTSESDLSSGGATQI